VYEYGAISLSTYSYTYSYTHISFLPLRRLPANKVSPCIIRACPGPYLPITSFRSVDENGDENGLRGEQSTNRSPFSSPFSLTDLPYSKFHPRIILAAQVPLLGSDTAACREGNRCRRARGALSVTDKAFAAPASTDGTPDRRPEPILDSERGAPPACPGCTYRHPDPGGDLWVFSESDLAH